MVAPATITVYDNLYAASGAAVSGATVNCVLNGTQETTAGGLISPTQQSTTTDGSGRFAFTVVCNDLLSPANSTYTIMTPFRTYDIAPQSANGASQQTTAANVIVNTPLALAPWSTITGPLTISGTLTVVGAMTAASLNVTAGEPGIDTTAAGALLIGDNNATSIEIGAPTSINAGGATGATLNAAGDLALRSITVGSSSPYSPTAAVGGADYSGAVRIKGSLWFDPTHPTYGALGNGTGNGATDAGSAHDDLAAFNAAIAAAYAVGSGVAVPPAPGGANATYYLSAALTNGNNVPLLCLGKVIFNGPGAPTTNLIRLGGGNLTFYVNTTGSDNNGGATSGTPFLTLQKAVNVAKDFPGLGIGPSINVASGSYAGFVYSGGGLGFNDTGLNQPPQGLNIAGGVGGGTTTITKSAGATACIWASGYGALVNLTGTITFTSTADALVAINGAIINLNSTSITFGACTTTHLHADSWGSIYISAGYTITGGAQAHIWGTVRGLITTNEATVTITLSGSPVFSLAFVRLIAGSTCYLPAAWTTFSGAAGATTIRFIVQDTAVLLTNNASATFIPGTAVGRLGMGGIYSPMPTPTITGLSAGWGVGATASVASGDENEGQIIINTGTGTGATGTFNISGNFLGLSGNPGALCLFLLQNFNGRATVIGQGSNTTPLWAIAIDNNAVNFPVSGSVQIHYIISPF